MCDAHGVRSRKASKEHHDDIDKQTAEFLANGGVIEETAYEVPTVRSLKDKLKTDRIYGDPNNPALKKSLMAERGYEE